MIDPQLRARLEKHIRDLPVLPQAVVKLMALDPDQDDFFDRLLDVIQPEPNYSARVLAMANSAASGSQVAITTLKAALSRIGSRGARNLILALAVTRVFVPRDDWEKSLWRHALHVAIAAREFARTEGDSEFSPEEAYACGLLHDIGRFVLFQEGPQVLRRIDEGEWDTPEGLLAMEKSICGLAHTDLGALACEHWKLPELICELVRNHHAPPAPAPQGKLGRLTAVVRAADLAMFPTAMPGTAGLEVADDATLRDAVQKQLPPFVKLSIPQLRTLLCGATEEASRAIQMLGLA